MCVRVHSGEHHRESGKAIAQEGDRLCGAMPEELVGAVRDDDQHQALEVEVDACQHQHAIEGDRMVRHDLGAGNQQYRRHGKDRYLPHDVVEMVMNLVLDRFRRLFHRMLQIPGRDSDKGQG